MKETYSHEFNWYQKIFQVLLGMWRINIDSIDFNGFEIFSNCFWVRYGYDKVWSWDLPFFSYIHDYHLYETEQNGTIEGGYENLELTYKEKHHGMWY